MNTIKIYVVMVATIIMKSYAQNVHIINIPDANFKHHLLQSSVNRNGDNEIDSSEANNFVNLDIPYLNIRSLEGIEEFSNLKHIDFSGNNVRVIDFSRNQKLESLVGDNNALVYLEIRYNDKLKHLSCHGNQLQLLRLPTSGKLKYLKASSNLLTFLDISQAPDLDAIHVSNNNLVDLNTSSNINLIEIFCDNNRISSLDVSTNNILTRLNCSNNRISSLDIRSNSKLKVLNCENNELRFLKIYYLGESWFSLQTLNATSNRLLDKIYTNDLMDALRAKSRRFFLVDEHTRFVSYNVERKKVTKKTTDVFPLKIDLIVSTNEISYHSEDGISSLDVEIFSLNGVKLVKKTKLTNRDIINYNSLSSGVYIVVLYVETKKISKLVKVDIIESRQLIRVD